MANETQLFHIDTIVVAGKTISFEDSTGTLTGAARWENCVVPSASGPDKTNRKRVPTTLRCKLQFDNTVNPNDFAKISQEQIAVRDAVGGRKALMNKCSFGSMGEIGGGSVDVTFNVLDPIQWL